MTTPRSKINALLAKAGESDFGKNDVLWAIADTVVGAVDSSGVAKVAIGQAYSGAKFLAGARDAYSGDDIKPNPYFVWNGFDDLPSPTTLGYLKHRKKLGVGSAAFSLAGGAASGATVVDVGAVAQGANALGSTCVHVIKLQAMARGMGRSDTLRDWLECVIAMKMLKSAMRGGQVASGVFATGGVGSLVGSAISTAAGLGIKASTSHLCVMLAFQLHWRAFQETRLVGGLGGGKKDSGPATRILDEIFTRRGFTRIFGQHDIRKMIGEPGGWQAVSDKLQQM